MDAAVGLVQAYLRANGFLTVTEYPILQRGPDGQFREATDIDVVALRRGGAGRVMPAPMRDAGQKMDVDPVLDLDWRRTEIIIAEVKEGPAETNRTLMHRGVLAEVLRRFGLAPRRGLKEVLRGLHDDGQATWEGHRVQLLAFGSRPPYREGPCRYIALGDVVDYLEAYIEAHRRIGATPRFRDQIVSTLALRAKALKQDGADGS